MNVLDFEVLSSLQLALIDARKNGSYACCRSTEPSAVASCWQYLDRFTPGGPITQTQSLDCSLRHSCDTWRNFRRLQLTVFSTLQCFNRLASQLPAET